jgi:GNAT superfamily N-acetyltransferase
MPDRGMRVKIESLTIAHDCSRFDCGNPVLNTWLAERALGNHRLGFTHVRVGVCGEEVTGYCGLSNASIIRAEAPRRLRGSQAPDPIPAILIGRFAVATSLQGKGLGQQLFGDALLRCWQIAQLSGVRLVMVHAKDAAAAAFYARYGFQAHQERPMTLYLTTASLAPASG